MNKHETVSSVSNHISLHCALKVSVKTDEETGEVTFNDVDRTQSNLFRNDSHSDRLLSHYMENQEDLEKHSKKGYCHCELYAKKLKSDRLYGVKFSPFSIADRLSRTC